MWKESAEKKAPLKTGLTTGSCATACCVAAATFLLSGEKPLLVQITLPKKALKKTLNISQYQVTQETVMASTIKDAGDDPDVTHGATVFVELSKKQDAGITFLAADGVGTVTREGLEIAVGEPAINPVPRKMMTEHLQKIALEYNYSGGFIVKVGVVNGQEIAKKTMNARLGILGGLSILGTTGIVRPFSCAAWISSIRQGIDVADANGFYHVAASTGNTSEASIAKQLALESMALIEMGDFAGVVLKHVNKKQIKRLSICGGFGKITKLANAHLDLNSRSSSMDFEHIADVAQSLGADDALCLKIKNANTSIEALHYCIEANVSLADKMCELALHTAQTHLNNKILIDIWAINRQGEFVGYADNFLQAQGGQV